MPAVSKKQRIVMAIAEHHPDQLYSKNKGLLEMSKSQLHDYASTPSKGLPEKKRGYGSGKRSGHGRHRRERGE